MFQDKFSNAKIEVNLTIKRDGRGRLSEHSVVIVGKNNFPIFLGYICGIDDVEDTFPVFSFYRHGETVSDKTFFSETVCDAIDQLKYDFFNYKNS